MTWMTENRVVFVFSFLLLGNVAAAARVFKHPGSLDTIAGLNFVRDRIAARAQPWLDWFNIAHHGQFATRTPHGGASTLDAHSGAAQDGGDDAYASYVQALLWHYTNDTTFAERSIAILNSWSSLKNITASDEQNKLQAGWMGADFGPAAEIMRMYSGWAPSQIKAFQNMIKTAFYPQLTAMSDWNGNVDLTQIDAMMSLSVFLEDETLFNEGLARLKTRTLSYFYLRSDGPPSSIPPIPGDGGNVQAFWSNPTKWVDGLTQETCRDNGHHAQYALGSAIHACEVAWNQGLDIYSNYQERYTAALELLALQLYSGNMQGTCSNQQASGDKFEAWEIGFNHYHYLSKVPLANTSRLLLEKIRPTTQPGVEWTQPTYTQIYGTWNLVFDTLSHADIALP